MIRLTPALREQITAAIRAGGFPHVAAQAFGVSRHSFERWRRLGRSNESEEAFRLFAAAVEEAIGQARLRAEMEIFSEQPRIWLQHGPGRESRQSPGWTVAVKPIARNRSDGDPFTMPRVMAMLRTVMTALDGHPDAKASVVHALGRE